MLPYLEPLAYLRVGHAFCAGECDLRLASAQIVAVGDALNCAIKAAASFMNFDLYWNGRDSEGSAALENLFGLENLIDAIFALYCACALDAEFTNKPHKRPADSGWTVDSGKPTQASNAKRFARLLSARDLREHRAIELIFKRRVAQGEQSHLLFFVRRTKKLTGSIGRRLRLNIRWRCGSGA